MEMDVPYEFTENIIPYRCRKPRDVRFNDSLKVNIREVQACDAPVAIMQLDEHPLHPLPFRWFGGKLWTDESTFRRSSDGKYDSLTDSFRYDSWKSKKTVTKELRNRARNIIIIDGQIFKTASEPRYVVMTFGLGCNHGGTALMISHYFNSNISKSRYYRIDQREEAILEAERVAIARGDTKNVPIIPHADFEILIPDAVRVNPSKHGNGCSFENKIENVIQATKSPLASGLFAISQAFKA